MSKIKLGQTPKNFKKIVKFPLLDGKTGHIEVVYRYRTRKEFGLFIDELMNSAGVTTEQDPDAPFSMQALMEKTGDSNADYLLEVMEAWDLDVPLTKESAQQLSDEIPAAAMAIMETYRMAITEGRLGN
jgi:hypothetical protein